MGVADAEATLVAFSSVDGGDCVPGHTSLYREVCELERRVRAVDHLTFLARLARGADAVDDEREKAFAREEPCLGRARELLQVSDDLVSAETAVLAWEGVRAASSAAKSGDADALAAAAETATGLETALRRVRDPHDLGGRLRASGALGEDEDGHAHLTLAAALDALHAAARALRAAAAERGARASAEKENVPKQKRSETKTSQNERAPSVSFSSLAPRLAETCGRWSRAHAAMSAELRGRNPLESRTETAGSAGGDDDDDPEADDEETRRLRDETAVSRKPSRWARRAAGACRILTEAAKGLTQNDDGTDSADLAPLLADLLDRTARAAGNFAAHQPRLWPKSRTLAQVCAARRDAEAVDDAVAACLKVLEEAHARARANETSAEAGESVRVGHETETETETDAKPEPRTRDASQKTGNESADSEARAALTRAALAHALPVARRAAARSRTGAAALTEGIAACVRRACAEAYETAPTGNWSSRKVSANPDPRGSFSTTLACLPPPSSAKVSSGAKENAPVSQEDEALHPVDPIVRLASDATRDIALKRVLRPLFESLDRLGDGSLGARTRSAAVPAAGAAALDALLARAAAEGPGGVRCAGGGAERLEADGEALIGAVERALLMEYPKEKETGAPKGTKGAPNKKKGGAHSREAWRGATKRARAAVAVALAAGSAKGSAAKGQAYANARAALGAEEAETWRRVCVK